MGHPQKGKNKKRNKSWHRGGVEEKAWRCFNKAARADHDHDTGEPRSALCHGCNVALGFMDEDVTKINGLLEYAIKCQNVKRSAEFVDFMWIWEGE